MTSYPTLEPCFSLRLVLPFLKVVSGQKGISEGLIAKLSAMAPDDRLPVSRLLRWLDSAVQVSGDPDLGLKAVLRVERGGYDVIEYAGRSASNWGEALELMLRYIRLVNEAADFSLQVRERRAFVELRSRVPLNRAASDFQAATVSVAARAWIGSLDTFEIWLTHAEPRELGVYRRIFGDAPIHFGAAQDAVSFDSALLEVPMKSADPKLNAVLRRHAEHLISELPEPDWLTGKVRQLLLNLLPAGKTNADYVATRLGMSRRTLTRHLEREGVTYKDLLEQARRELAYQYLSSKSADIQQIAFMLGYSETAAFSRAFRRWSGQSPAEYRRSRGG
ncbi:MAG: AraC family transcriptional regulator ligand-binding domain-containing protein [Myxococcales bacterium]